MTGAVLTRRALICGAGAGLLGGVAGGALLTSVRSDRGPRVRLTLDVAWLGPTWAEAPTADGADAGDSRAPFVVEGWVYPGGAIKGDGYLAVEAGSIGRFFCHGYTIVGPSRAEPHTISQQHFVFGAPTAESPFPVDSLVASGLEGGGGYGATATRAVLGGTGRYLGASGRLTERFLATNTSHFAGTAEPSPCYRVEFDLTLDARSKERT